MTPVDSAALVIISLAFLYLLYRVNRLQAIYITLQVNKAKAYQLFTTTQAQINTLTPHIFPEIDNRILYVLLTLASITLVCIAFKYLVRRIRHASIALEITDGHNCVIIPLINVPFCPNFYHFQTSENFDDLDVNGIFQPVFSWNPGSLMITQLVDKTRLEVP